MGMTWKGNRSEDPIRGRVLIGVITFVLLACLVLLSAYQLQPPDPVPVGASLTEFSSQRALQHLPRIARSPHPMGSPENARVRDYLVGRLADMGLDPQVQTASVSHFLGGRRLSGTPSNILVRIKGTANTRAILLSAHYDSVAGAPGAADNGAGVVVLLETLRALLAGPPLKNDVIFLFDDGEEAGLLGARAFVERHPWAREVGLALNFDARGTSGPSWMVRASDGNGGLIREFARVAPHPVASSLIYALVEKVPNTYTNHTLFEQAGMPGLDFAMAGDPANYHSPLDTVENLDERSLQHHGSYALALTRHFGSLDLDEVRGENVLYFSLLGSMVYYPQAWVLPLAAGATVLFVGVLALGLRRRSVSFAGLALGFLASLASGVAAGVLVALAYLAMWVFTRGAIENAMGVTRGSHLYTASFLALAVAVASALHNWLREKIHLYHLVLGGLLWWLLLATLTSLFLPGGSYLVLWPLILSLLAVAFALLSSDPKLSPTALVALLLPAVPSLLLLAPAVYALFTFAPLSGPVVMYPVVTSLVGLLLAPFVPHLHLMAVPGKGRWGLPIGAVLVAFVLLAEAGRKFGLA